MKDMLNPADIIFFPMYLQGESIAAGLGVPAALCILF